MICTGCALLCDDVIIINDSGNLKVRNACRRGAKLIANYKNLRADATINGKKVNYEEAIERVKEIINNSESLAIYGMDTISIEAQKLAIELAERKEAYIDDNSTFCLGDFVEMILKKEIPSTTLDEVRDYAYVIFYWGTNPFHTLSRHMSKFTYYPRGKRRQRGYEEDRFLVVVDVRRSHTAKLAKKNAKFFEVRDDLELIQAFIDALDGKPPKIFANDVFRVIKEMEKSDFNVIFGGLGLRYGLKGKYDKFLEMIRKMNERTKVYFIPLGCHPNMRGFNELLYGITGYVNKYSFKDKESKEDFAFYNLLFEEKIDTALIIGTDPLNSLPFEYAKKLAKINVIVIDPRENFTTKIADVVLPSAITGIECGGKMKRIDGVEITLEPMIEAEIDDVSIIKSILNLIMEGI